MPLISNAETADTSKCKIMHAPRPSDFSSQNDINQDRAQDHHHHHHRHHHHHHHHHHNQYHENSPPINATNATTTAASSNISNSTPIKATAAFFSSHINENFANLNRKWTNLNRRRRRNSSSGDPKELDMLVLKSVDWDENESF
ncbi:rho GTPase-activating protein gacG-like [Hermetia illucens]|uniref:rho GTPase-activating protein gacG-like n=1 Tax=Hermetia illucens TaxID=343691 RepID=UPI0018CC2F61|nr:rho GTPase-activating protein gacG-like [Hermetia illucens]